MQREGTVRIIPVHTQGGGEDKFLLTWVRYSFGGGALPSREFAGEVLLKNFLSRELRISSDEMEAALNDLRNSRVGRITHLTLSPVKAKELGLER